jgi:hypothetical protein
MYELLLQSARAEQCLGLHEAALRLLDEAQLHARSTLQKAEVDSLRIRSYAVTQPAQALSVGRESLIQLGMRLPDRGGRVRLFWTCLLTDLGVHLRIKILRKCVAPHSERYMAMLLITATLAGVLIRNDARMTFLFIAYILRQFLRHGPVRAPAFALGGYAHLRLVATRRARYSRKLAEVALELNDSTEPLLWARSAVQIEAMAEPWFLPRRGLLARMKHIEDRALEVGDLEYASYAKILSAYNRVLSGSPVSETIQALDETVLCASRWNHASLERVRGIRILYGLLLESRTDTCRVEVVHKVIRRTDLDISGPLLPHALLVLCVFSRFEEAFSEAQSFSRRVHEQNGSSSAVVDFTFFRGIAAAVVAQSRSRSARRAPARVLHACIRRFRWEELGDDFAHYPMLLQAERQRLAGHERRALILYERGARMAESRGYLHHAALAHERCSSLLRPTGRRTLGDQALRRAANLYERWGALEKLRSLD